MIEDFASKAECSELRERAEQIIDDFDPKTVSIFSTKDQVSVSQLSCPSNLACAPCMYHLANVKPMYSYESSRKQDSTTDNYFLDSANNVSCFFEEKAFDEDGNLKQAKSKSINKIGHGKAATLSLQCCGSSSVTLVGACNLVHTSLEVVWGFHSALVKDNRTKV